MTVMAIGNANVDIFEAVAQSNYNLEVKYFDNYVVVSSFLPDAFM